MFILRSKTPLPPREATREAILRQGPQGGAPGLRCRAGTLRRPVALRRGLVPARSREPGPDHALGAAPAARPHRHDDAYGLEGRPPCAAGGGDQRTRPGHRRRGRPAGHQRGHARPPEHGGRSRAAARRAAGPARRVRRRREFRPGRLVDVPGRSPGAEGRTDRHDAIPGGGHRRRTRSHRRSGLPPPDRHRPVRTRVRPAHDRGLRLRAQQHHLANRHGRRCCPCC